MNRTNVKRATRQTRNPAPHPHGHRRQRTPSAGKPDAARLYVRSGNEREGTRTPEKHECPGQRLQPGSVELLIAYSHTVQAADLHGCVLTATQEQRPKTKSATPAPWSIRERLSDDMIQAMGCAYSAGAAALELAVAHDLSLSSVKRLLRTTKARKSGTTQ